jgi:hypothetical protein
MQIIIVEIAVKQAENRHAGDSSIAAHWMSRKIILLQQD